MGIPSISLGSYTFKYDTEDFDTSVTFGADDGRVRSVELEALNGSSAGFYLTERNGNVLLNFPNIPASATKAYSKFTLRFVLGYTDYDDEDYDVTDLEYSRVDIDVYATRYDYDDPRILYIENLASRVGEPASVVVHGESLTDGLSIIIIDGEKEYVVPPEDIEFDIDAEGNGTAAFTITPGMLALNADGTEPCAQYNIYFGYGNHRYEDLYQTGIIRYKYDSENDELQKYSTEGVTREKTCYETGSMSLVYDTVDENGNPVMNPEADPKLGNDIYIKKRVYVVTDPDKIFGGEMDKYGLRTEKDDGYVLNDGDVVLLYYQDNPYDNGYWIVRPTFWKHVHNCEEYIYTMVRVKYNKNLTHKSGELKLNGVQLHDGDVVWLSHQLVESENGLWVVRKGLWEGYNPWTYEPEPYEIVDCPLDCHETPLPYPVDDSVLVDLGAKASYPVDYVCRDDVPYKCGSRTICNYKVEPGKVVALLNQEHGENGIYLVKCGAWEKLADVTDDVVNGTTVDFTDNIIVQNDIDFCECGGVFHIDYFFLTPSCYLHHLQRTVKVMCADASIAPNKEENQFKITDYQIRMGEEEALIGNKGRTPGDPVKDDCTVANEDFEVDFGLGLVEHRQYIEDPECIRSPMCTGICDIPRVYNLRMTSDYTSSNDRNGFTIKFWRYEKKSWHLYAYIGSGTQQNGMDYYVYHLHVKGKATENLVDVNEHEWFRTTTGVIASGDGADSFGICDDTWTQHNLNEYTLYQPWRIKCTTNLLAHCYDDPDSPHILRTTCADMETGWKTTAAIGDEDVEGYLQGMPHLFGVAYYTTAMSKSQFVEEYNKYDPYCIWPDTIDVLVTDDETVDKHGQPAGNYGIATDDEKVLRR